jgi:hypothetical protein
MKKKVNLTSTAFFFTLILIIGSQLKAASFSLPVSHVATPPAFEIGAAPLLLLNATPNNTSVTFNTNREATYSNFQFNANVSNASLAALLGVSLATISKTDFIAFDTHGVTPNKFESSEWTFTEGGTSITYNHVFGANTITSPLLVDIAISNVGVGYNAIFGTSFPPGQTFGVLLFDLSDVGISVGSSSFDVTLTGSTSLPGDPDITFLGVINHPSESRFEYAAKLVCGIQSDTRNMQLARGFYATTINVRNPNESAVTFEKKLSLTIPPGGQAPGRVYLIAIDTLRTGEALAVDCDDIRDRVFDGSFPAPFIEGYVVIQSPESLDVTGVYSTATLNAEETAENHSSFHIEPIKERKL